ncbi:MAG: type II/IV secretion system protein [Planctomycetota bacterium]|nr:MAG: type II/IV secretion system protein [Planctomycetota bacterium]
MAKIRFEAGKKEDPRKTQMQSQIADTSVVQKVDGVIEKALELEATDIHFEPSGDEVLVRGKVHGEFQQIETFPGQLLGKIINRIKILSAMDITNTKHPQSGFFKVVTDESKIEILSYTFPTIRGEKAVLNIQYTKGVTHSLEDLGMIPTMLETFRESLNKQNGLIVVAGPPGNGKNTTLYACLQYLNSPTKSLATFEPMVKYELAGVTQGKPDEKSDFTFEEGVRGIINTNPDVLLIGEVQTPEVAKMTVQAAFGKRIVLARMSSNSAIGALQNFIDMGIQPFLVSSAINTILAQRLARKLCEKCKEEYVAPNQLIQELGLKPGILFYKPKGCEECHNTGYNGFIGIFELLTMGDEIREMVIGRESPKRIQERARQLGMIELKKDGIYKAVKGITSIEEALNVL